MVGTSFDGPSREPPVNSAAPFVRKAGAIAQQLQHEHVEVAHLLLSIAQSKLGAELLQRHDLAAKSVRECCLRELEGVLWTTEWAEDVQASSELNELLRRSAALGSGGVFEVDHVLRAINEPEVLGRFVRLMRTTAPKPEHTHDLISGMKEQLDKELPDIRQELGVLQAGQLAASAQLIELQRNVGVGTRMPNLHHAADLLRARVTSLKLWIALSATAVLVFVLLVRIIRP